MHHRLLCVATKVFMSVPTWSEPLGITTPLARVKCNLSKQPTNQTYDDNVTLFPLSNS